MFSRQLYDFMMAICWARVADNIIEESSSDIAMVARSLMVASDSPVGEGGSYLCRFDQRTYMSSWDGAGADDAFASVPTTADNVAGADGGSCSNADDALSRLIGATSLFQRRVVGAEGPTILRIEEAAGRGATSSGVGVVPGDSDVVARPSSISISKVETSWLFVDGIMF